MALLFRPTNYDSLEDCAAFAEWENDPELRRLWVPTQGEYKPVTAEDIQAKYRKPKDAPFSCAVDEVAILGGKIIGQYTIILNPPHKRSTANLVSWPSVIIGEASLRGTGLVRRFLHRIRDQSRALGASHIEVGVFEFNLVMRSLLEKTGFKEFDRLDNITVRDGRGWADIRYQREV